MAAGAGAGRVRRLQLLWQPVLLLLCQVLAAESKLHRGTVRIGGGGEDRWQYLGKFGYAIGVGTYELRLRLQRSPGHHIIGATPHVKLDIFLDEEWDRVMTLPSCSRSLDGPARVRHPFLRIGQAGEWGPWENSSLYQVVRPHIWYFALSDCRDSIGKATYELDYEIRWRQFDGAEFSFELRHMLFVNVLVLACLTTFLVRFSMRCLNLWRQVDAMHPVIRGLAAAAGLQWLAQALHTLHMWVYRSDGVGMAGSGALAEVLFMLSQVAAATLLVAIAQGYTLFHSRVSELHLLRPVAGMVAALHVLLVGLDKLRGEASDTHHVHGGMLGAALLTIRLLLFSWFTAGIRRLRQRGGFRLQPFLDRFQLAGSAYLLAFPVLWAVVQLFAAYLRQPILHTGLLATQTVVSLWLAEVFLCRSSYFEVSELSASLLPGGSRGFSLVSRAKAD